VTDINRSVKTRLVWDLPTRLFHWVLVALVALAWASGETEGRFFLIHRLAGYGVLVAIVFRLIWGFVGNRHARFRDFVHTWRSVRDYTKGLLALRPRPTLGHNPLGGWMIVLLLITLLGVSVTGLFAFEEGARGPLAHWLSPEIAHGLAELHEGLANLLLILIGIHIVGVVVDSLLTGHNLIGSMFTGRKRCDSLESGPVSANETVSGWSAALALAAATGLTWLLVG
jgi:cytochrome b